VPIRRRIQSGGVAIDFAAIRAELGIRADYPAEAVAEAVKVAGDPPVNPRDATGIPFVTVDPPGSKDLDQAVHLERLPDGGFRVHYAIADVAEFVRPGGPIDIESRRRGQTFYSPDTRTPLHPLELSEGAASLLPGEVRPAVLWTIELDPDGAPTEIHVERAEVRSVAQLDYPSLQDDVEAGRAHSSVALLPEIGRLRQATGKARHAITLNRPDVEVVPTDDGRWTLALRPQVPVEEWNAEISLLTGMCAADMMTRAKVGLLRTLPPPDARAVATLRGSAKALGISWPSGALPGDVIADLHLTDPRAAAFLEDAVLLLRGAGYTWFDGRIPDHPGHAGVGANYAHVTAPLRRLVDRYATEVCLALQAGTPIPDWVSADADAVIQAMTESDRTAGALDRACAAAVSAFLLAVRIGEEFGAVVVQLEQKSGGVRATVVLDDWPIRAYCAGAGLTEGTRIRVRVVSADPDAHQYTVEPVVAGSDRQ
jgi:exoribonuclease R